MSTLEKLAGLLTTEDPKQARKDRSGAGGVGRKRTPPPESVEIDEIQWIPILALGAAAALLIWATTRPNPALRQMLLMQQYQADESEQMQGYPESGGDRQGTY